MIDITCWMDCYWHSIQARLALQEAPLLELTMNYLHSVLPVMWKPLWLQLRNCILCRRIQIDVYCVRASWSWEDWQGGQINAVQLRRNDFESGGLIQTSERWNFTLKTRNFTLKKSGNIRNNFIYYLILESGNIPKRSWMRKNRNWWYIYNPATPLHTL